MTATPSIDRSPRATPRDAVRLARRRFRHGERVDMTSLADELGVNRVTLYRWVGSRERLLVEVVWSLAEDALADALAHEPGEGADRIARTLARFLATVIDNAGMQHWLAAEGEAAMRLLTRHEPDFQPRLIAAVEALLTAESIELPVDRHELAYVLVRVIESYTYLDLITGERPDAARAAPILRMLLRCAP
jgi:AcrR family transcriptional regulator